MLNDEAHHCYQDKPLAEPDEKADKERAGARTSEARVWFSGLQAIAQAVGVKHGLRPLGDAVLPEGLGLPRGLHLPVGGQRLLADGRDRVGHRQGPAHPGRRRRDDRRLVDLPATSGTTSATSCPKRAAQGRRSADWLPPEELEGALRSLYRSYEQALRRTGRRSSRSTASRRRSSSSSAPTRSSPSWSSTGSPASRSSSDDEVDRSQARATSPLLQQRRRRPAGSRRPRTILVDSAQLESGEAMKDDFKKAAGRGDRGVQGTSTAQRNPGADADKLTDEDLLREVMNTVGKPGKLGEQVRCVVSVSMLTEGWDANTVTHILGVRAFGSQLLCEQVVGRGLRRRSTRSTSDGLLRAGVRRGLRRPVRVHLRPTSRSRTRSPPKPVDRGRARSRTASDLRIEFPSSTATASSSPTSDIWLDLDDARRASRSARTRCRRWVEMGGVVGERELERGRPDAVPRRSRSPSRSPSASSTRNFTTVEATSGPGSSRSWSRSCQALARARASTSTGGYSLGLPA